MRRYCCGGWRGNGRILCKTVDFTEFSDKKLKFVFCRCILFAGFLPNVKGAYEFQNIFMGFIDRYFSAAGGRLCRWNTVPQQWQAVSRALSRHTASFNSFEFDIKWMTFLPAQSMFSAGADLFTGILRHGNTVFFLSVWWRHCIFCSISVFLLPPEAWWSIWRGRRPGCRSILRGLRFVSGGGYGSAGPQHFLFCLPDR